MHLRTAVRKPFVGVLLGKLDHLLLRQAEDLAGSRERETATERECYEHFHGIFLLGRMPAWAAIMIEDRGKCFNTVRTVEDRS